jgi:hypothetical protein
VLGFRVSEKSVSEITSDISEKLSELEPAKTVVVLQLLDNVSYECRNELVIACCPERAVTGVTTLPERFQLSARTHSGNIL